MTNGYTVFLPITEQQDTDLVVVRSQGPAQKVQVKTTGRKEPSGSFIVQLRTSGGNRREMRVKNFGECRADLVFVVTDDETLYLIPRSEITTQTAVTLGPVWNTWIVN